MKNDYREEWWKMDEAPEEENSFVFIAQVCGFFAGLILLAIIGFNF